jgi:hypothetical protein
MNLRGLILFVLLSFAYMANASVQVANTDNTTDSIVIIDTDSLLARFLSKENVENVKVELAKEEIAKEEIAKDVPLSKTNAEKPTLKSDSTEALVQNIVESNLKTIAENPTVTTDSTDIGKTETLLERFFSKETISGLKEDLLQNASTKNPDSKDTILSISKNMDIAKDTLIAENNTVIKDTVIKFTIPEYIEDIPHDSLLLRANPFFIDLVFRELPLNLNLTPVFDFGVFYFKSVKFKYAHGFVKTLAAQRDIQIIDDLRRDAYRNISATNADLFAVRWDKLPDPNGIKSRIIEGRKLTNVKFVDGDLIGRSSNKLVVKKEKLGPWYYKANSLAQFSQNYVSPNWYKGGNSNVAILGILSGNMNYDNKKSIQWENYAEWKMGFNSVEGDTIRMFSTNDDVIKLNSKLGIKAGGNWFYSGSVDLSTQFFNSYKGINSTDLKAAFLAPLRLNIGVGFDYKYKKFLSLMLSPVSYKYIYVNEKIDISHNLFGVKADENHLSEIGSSFKAVINYPITPEIQLDSKLSFYTNYEKVEFDWEVVCNMTINRFMSTRISINPRYDNTVIEAKGEKAKWQFKQLLSVGFSHRF